MHAEVRAFVRTSCAGEYGRVVEFGSLDVNGGVRDLVAHQAWWGLDLLPGPGVDQVGDCRDYYPLSPADLVLCLEVLEHSDDAAGICEAAGRVLAPGGLFVMTCAGPGRAPHGRDGGPVGDEFYRNVSAVEFREWVPWGEVRVLVEDHAAGDLRAVVVKGPDGDA